MNLINRFNCRTVTVVTVRCLNPACEMFDLVQQTVTLCEGGHASPFRFFGDHNKCDALHMTAMTIHTDDACHPLLLLLL